MIKKKRSIRITISLAFIILMVSTLTTAGYIIFSNWKASSNKIIEKLENETSSHIVNDIEALINVPLHNNEINHNLLENGILDLKNKGKREAFFAGVINASGEEIYSFSYGLENGEYYGARRNADNKIELYRVNSETLGHSAYFLATEELKEGEFVGDFGEFDPRTREWYKIAKEKKQPVFSPLYKHFVKEDFALSAAYPVYSKEGELQGVLGTHITLRRLNKSLMSIAEDRGGVAYIHEKNSGQLVANSTEKPNFTVEANGLMNRIDIGEIDNKYIIEAYEKFKDTSKESFIMDTKNDRLHIKFTEYKKDGLDWIIVTSFPESLYTADIYRNIRTGIFFSILAIVISMAIYMKITDIILKPIKHLLDAAERFSKGDLKDRARIFKNDEI